MRTGSVDPICSMQSGWGTMNVVPFVCEICHAPFEKTKGGRCQHCGRIVCRDHLVWSPYGIRCVECQKAMERERSRKA
jgi:hypothetical protein